MLVEPEQVRQQRVQDAKDAEAKKRRNRQEELSISREVDRIRSRETKFTSKLVKDREELRKKAGRKNPQGGGRGGGKEDEDK